VVRFSAYRDEVETYALPPGARQKSGALRMVVAAFSRCNNPNFRHFVTICN